MPDQTTTVWQRPYHGRLFGTFSLSGADGGDLTPQSRKARALVAYLLSAGPAPVSRDRLIGLLWGSRGEEQARASLRQTLYELRPLTGGAVPLIEVDRTRILLVQGRHETDLDLLRSLASGGDAEAFADWLGEEPAALLADLDGIDAGFDEWLAAERARRREERHIAALAVCRRALDMGDGEAAYLLAARLLTAEPLDERAAQMAMEACHRRGDRNGVHRIFGQYRTVLDAELGLPPPEALVTLHKRLMSAASPSIPQPTQTPKPLVDDEPQAVLAPKAIRRRWVWGAGAASFMAVVAIGAALWLRPHTGDAGARLLLVAPLRTAAGDAGANVLRDGLSAQLAQMIVGNNARLTVVDARDDRTAAEHDEGYAVAGEAQTSGDALHASVRLLASSGSVILWSGSFVRPVAEVEAMRQQIASKIADVAVCALGGPNPPLRELGVDLMRLYLGACEQKHGDWSQSAKLLEQVVKQRPNVAHAWAMLAAATAGSASMLPDAAADPVWARADEYARHAMALDPSDGEAYPPHAFALRRPDQWPERMAILIAGYKVEPSNSVLNWCIADQLAAVGRWREGIVYAKHAAETDPFSQYVAADLGRYLAYGHMEEDFADLLAKADRLWPGDPLIDELRFRVEAFLGDPVAAAALLADPHRHIFTSHRMPLWQAFLSARKEQTSERIAAVVQAARADASHAGSPDDMMEDAMFLTVVGQIDQAYAITDQIGRRPLEAGRVLFYSFMAPYRADPRFMDFAERQGLVAIWKATGQSPDFCSDKDLGYDCGLTMAALAP